MGQCRRIPRDLATGKTLEFPAGSMQPTKKAIYCDPLIVNGKQFDGELTDVYSCGACLFVLLVKGSPPFKRIHDHLFQMWAQEQFTAIALIEACSGQCELKIVRFLVEKGIPINKCEKEFYEEFHDYRELSGGRNALREACYKRNLEVIAYLLENGASVMKPCFEEMFSPNWSRTSQAETEFEVIKLLVSCGSYLQLCPKDAMKLFKDGCQYSNKMDMKLVELFPKWFQIYRYECMFE